MNNRVTINLAPDLYQAALKLEEAHEALGLQKHYGALIRIRASQINGCAYSLTQHFSDLEVVAYLRVVNPGFATPAPNAHGR